MYDTDNKDVITYKPLTSGDYNTYQTDGVTAGWNWWYKGNINDPSLQ